MEHILTTLSRRYPQLLFPIEYGIKDSQAYRDAVYAGKEYKGNLCFSMSEKDQLICVDTPVGKIEVLLLHDRRDFEHCLCALAYKCEPREIPSSVGASFISGLINWERINSYLDRYASDDTASRANALKRLNLTKHQYLDRLILLSSGWYSGIRPEATGLTAEEWSQKSLIIRMYHELTHYVCRTLYPDNVQIIRDEVFADMIGLVAAFGCYENEMGKLLLGIDGQSLSSSSRLYYYLKDQAENMAALEATGWIEQLCNKIKYPTDDIFEFMITLFDEIQ